MTEPTKVIVIGAGWSGLAAARTYLEVSKLLDRPIDLAILDDSNDPGGVWSTSRLYPGLIANSPVGLYEYSHMSMVDEKHPWYQLLPGDGVQTYLEAYAHRFDIFSKIRFRTRVTGARRNGNGAKSGWVIETDKGETHECDKVIVACGLYNKPRIPSIPSSTYAGVSIHVRDLGKRNAELRADSSIKNIIVVGGCKSAIEACNVFLPDLNPNKTHRVSWVIRPSDTGVPLVVQDVDKTGNIIAVNQTRVFSAISPSIYDIRSFSYRFLHSGSYLLGSLLTSLIWRLMSWALTRDAKYDSSANGRKIKPQGSSMFFDVNAISLVPPSSPVLRWLHEDNDNIFKVHRATPTKLQGKEMVIISPDGKTSMVPCDAVIWCTGWLPSIDFFSEEETKNLGLPVLLPQKPSMPNSKNSPHNPDVANPRPPQTYTSHLSPDSEAAEREILGLFPRLRTPARPGYPPPFTPYRLYRQCIPLSSFPSSSLPSNADSTSAARAGFDRSIAFSGLVSNSQTAICSELTALYCVAFLEDLLPTTRTHTATTKSNTASTIPSFSSPSASTSTPTPKSITGLTASHSTALTLAFQRRRYGIKGSRDPEIVLEVQSFLDTICADLGVRVDRKRKRWEDTYLRTSSRGTGTDLIWNGKDEKLESNGAKSSVNGDGNGTPWYAGIRGWFKENFTPYFAGDYEGVIEEFLVGNGYLKSAEGM
jgi:dimethylaniline monooxygenase (N-oxide forming)